MGFPHGLLGRLNEITHIKGSVMSRRLAGQQLTGSYLLPCFLDSKTNFFFFFLFPHVTILT